MPSAPKPKQFVAAKNFKHGRKMYRKGDPVTQRRTIDLLSKRGDRWITRAAPNKTVTTEPDPLPEEAASDGS